MRWLARKDRWFWGFALWPLRYGSEMVWLEPFRWQLCGDYVGVLTVEDHRRLVTNNQPSAGREAAGPSRSTDGQTGPGMSK